MKVRRKNELSKAYADLEEHLERHKQLSSELTELEIRANIRDQKNAIIAFSDNWISSDIRIQGMSRWQHGSANWEAEQSGLDAERKQDFEIFIARIRALYFGVHDSDLRIGLIAKHCEIAYSHTHEAALKCHIEECLEKHAGRITRWSIEHFLSPSMIGIFCVYVTTYFARPEYQVECAIAGAVAGLFLGKAEMDRLKAQHESSRASYESRISDAKAEFRRRQNLPLYFSYSEQTTGVESVSLFDD